MRNAIGAVDALASLCLAFCVAYLNLDPFRYRDKIQTHARQILLDIGYYKGYLEEFENREHCQHLLLLAGEIPKPEKDGARLPFILTRFLRSSDRRAVFLITILSLLIVICIASFRVFDADTGAIKWLSVFLFVILSLALSAVTILGAFGHSVVSNAINHANKCNKELLGYMKPSSSQFPVG